ncbi:hypothetical protein ASD65_04890 [Microbacterium sp. Root61]|uniref:pyridoxamine 5'-phosphate oxidase family protein n=1 Tax=Microbacterium sp. Root61 TaxID=1736570 RepID=UPI0006FF49A1|nr:pyridoxamine 5'-phosphate oxidase family protein [Microbacterium sp. Root61]KRA23831.1 hypothetical protein ASD65_04890 [Microbacterium sp. Root61]
MEQGELIEFVRTHGDAVVATVGADGHPHASYVSITATDRGELVFNARRGSRTVANIAQHPEVAVVVGGRELLTLQCEGRGSEPEETDRDRCVAAYVDAFPQFAASSTMPGIVFIRVTVARARLSDLRSQALIASEWAGAF